MPADIGRLPRPNWMLSNNGFLMYSFVKYRYIVFAKVTQGRYELWVPGNYEKSEELMAQMFGFYCFRSVKSKKASAGEKKEAKMTVADQQKTVNPAFG